MFVLVGAVVMAEEASMDITATVLESLKVKTVKNMEFGNTAKGSTNSANGEFEIEGEDGADVLFSIPEKVEISNSKGGVMTVVLSSVKSISLSNGKANITVGGSLDVPNNQQMGAYKGDFIAKVRYQ